MQSKSLYVVSTLFSLICSQIGESSITKLNADGTFSVTNANTTSPLLLEIYGSNMNNMGSLGTNYIYASEECDFNGVRIGKGSGNLQFNTAIGYAVLDGASATGNYVTGIGSYALQNNSSGSGNAATGYATMQMNTKGNYNTASGSGALRYNTDGFENTALGFQALSNNKSNYNTAVGTNALYFNTGGNSNIAIGNNAGNLHRDGNTALTNTWASIYIGVNSRGLNNADYNSIIIGSNALGEGANTTVIGNSATVYTHLYGQTVSDSLKVNGSTVLNGGTILAGKVTLSQAQGDIPMLVAIP
jgi:hypothetical protein